VLGIAGSPRRGGNTETLLDIALSGANNAGSQTEKIILSDYCFSPCMSCGACNKTGECILKDDMQIIYKKILDADVMIFASPIYFYSVSAWSKSVIDRCQALWSRKYILKDPIMMSKKRRYFISVGATNGPRLFEGARLTMKYFFDAAGYEPCGELLISGVDHKGEILKHDEFLQTAYKLGYDAVGCKRD